MKRKTDDQVIKERRNRRKKITGYNHRGFDFDGAAGHDIQITNKISNRIHDAILKHLVSGPNVFNVSELSGSIGGGGLNSSQ